jgi:hypothetical protein
MATTEFRCPRCQVRRDVSTTSEEDEKLKRDGIGFCRTCGAVFRLNIDEKTGKWSFERLQDNLTVTLHSSLLNQDLTYVEQAMPENAMKALDAVIEQLKKANKISKPSTLSMIHGILDPEGAFFRDKSEEKIGQWILSDTIPQLEMMYTTYPFQVFQIMYVRGLSQCINPLTAACTRCGIGIPRARANNCPVCKDARIQKTIEDPVTILKLRLAKGEISKEEYEDLKKRIEI